MHIRFPDAAAEEPDGGRAGSHASAGPSGAPAPALRLVARHQLAADGGAARYCMGLALSPDRQLLAAAQSSGRVELLAPGATGLAPVGALEAHGGPVTGLAFDPGAPHTLLSCGADGALHVWDARSGQAASRRAAPPWPARARRARAPPQAPRAEPGAARPAALARRSASRCTAWRRAGTCWPRAARAGCCSGTAAAASSAAASRTRTRRTSRRRAPRPAGPCARCGAARRRRDAAAGPAPGAIPPAGRGTPV